MSEKVTERKRQFDPIRLLGVWRCKWDDWPVIAGLMLGNQSPSGLDINKHPSNCPFFSLIPAPRPGPAWIPTDNATTMRVERLRRLKEGEERRRVELIACTSGEKTRLFGGGGGFVCVGCFFSCSFLPRLSAPPPRRRSTPLLTVI